MISNQIGNCPTQRRGRSDECRACKTWQREELPEKSKISPKRIKDVSEITTPDNLGVKPTRGYTTKMVYRQCRDKPCLPPCVSRAMAKVGFFIIRPKMVVEKKSDFVQDGALEHHHCALRRKNPSRRKFRRCRWLSSMQVTLYPKRRHKDAAVIKAITKSRDVHCPLNNSDAFMRLQKLN